MPDDNATFEAPGTDMVPYQTPAPRETTPMAKMLKLYRASREVEQKVIAEEIGISPAIVSRIESGKSVDLHTTMRLLVWLFPVPEGTGV